MRGSAPDPVEEELEVGSWVLSLLRPPDVDSLLDEEAFSDDEFIPYWAELWPSGLALAEHVATLGLAGRRIVELGCGLGLPSLTASLAGADVVSTDWSDDAISLLGLNAVRNGARLRTLVADWGDPDPLNSLGPFDLVLAADVLYEARNVVPLVALLGVLGAPAIVADPGRRHADAFLASAAATGWGIVTVPHERLPRGGIHRLVPSGRATPVGGA
jgi:predicted nicotinamide N-methyase